MNILFVNSAKEWGGTEKWVVNTALGMAAKGHTVFFGCRGTLFDKRFVNGAVRLAKFPFANNLDVFTLARLRLFMVKNRIDVVLPSKQREYFLAGIAAKLGTKTKVAGMFGIDRPIKNLRNWLSFCKLFDIVLVVAEKIVPLLARTKGFDTKKCRLVYVGVDPITQSGDVRKMYRKELGLAAGDVAIMGIGRLTPQKGFDYALQAFAILLKKNHHEAKLIIVGPGDAGHYREIAADLGIVDKVVFTGFRNDIPELLQAADIYWLTSRSEGIPNTMLEAMSAGIPVVAFEIAGVAEVVRNGESGVLVPFEDVRMLADTTAALIDDPQRMKEIGERGQKRVSSDFSTGKMCDDTERHLQELLAGR